MPNANENATDQNTTTAAKETMPLAVYQLALCNAFMYICASLLITVSALIGFELAPNKTLSTLPLALQFIAVMSTSIPASLLMARIGRKYSFMFAAGIGMLGSVCALVAISQHLFWLFCVATFCFGSFTAFSNYYRFTAVEVVSPARKNLAISYVMAGGVLAGFIGPNLANWSQGAFESHRFAGAFVVLFVVYVLSLLTISRADLPPPPPRQKTYTGRPLSVIMLQPVFIVAVLCEMLGYGTMNLVMTSTPLAMVVEQHEIVDTAFVIQWHVVSMFLPSFFTGHLINRLGIVPVLAAGIFMGACSLFVNLSGTTVMHFTIGLVLLGICWNFLFVGGTTLLTECYRPEEKARTQAANDFIVFTTVSITALCAGGMHYLFGWRAVNFSVIPLLAGAALAIAWLYMLRRPGRQLAPD